MSQLLPNISALALVVGLAIVASMAFRRLGFRQGSILAGLLAGILCGPTVAGRIAPESWSDLVLGATEARRELRAANSEYRAWELAAGSSELDPTMLVEGANERQMALADLEERVAQETVAHARPWSICLVGGATLLILLSRIGAGGHAARPGPAGLAAWCGVLPGLATIVTMRMLGEDPFSAPVLLTAACVSCGSWSISHRSRALLHRFGASTIAVRGNRGAIIVGCGWALAAGLAGTPAWSVILVALVPFLLPNGIPRHIRRRASKTVEHLVIPALAALAVLRIEVLLEASVLLVVILTIVAGDGRALGWLIGLRFETDPTSPSRGTGWRVSMLASDASTTQLGLAAVAIGLGGVGAATAFALITSAGVVQAMSPARWWLAGADLPRSDHEDPS